MFRSVNKVHFVGIGGIGMSGIAELLLNLDFEVTGSDVNESSIIKNLRAKGAKIYQGHKAEHVGDADVLVYSSAVKEDNPELVAARNQGIPVIRRAEMLGELIAVKETSIAIGGTHGKTSTTSMIGAVLSAARMDPTLVVGGLVKTLDTNSLLGAGDVIVVEADEFDRSFLALRPTISVVTNIELEHTDCYRDLKDLQAAFTQFCNSVPFYGVLIACLDSPGVQGILPEIKRPVVSYGFSKQADYRAENPAFSEATSTYTVNHHGEEIGTIQLQVPGIHNVLNSLAAVTLGMEMGIPFDIIAKGLATYEGVRRRFEIKGIARDVMVVDDYAHHPTEVRATLKAARQGWDRRIIAVFQPHLYTRTRDFYAEFATAFLNSDILIVTDIFPARESAIPGITGELVAQAAKDSGHKSVYYLPELDRLEHTLDSIIQPNDMVITIGAGNIWRYCDAYFNHLQSTEIKGD
ncbi:MAG: UDP-N-acetylmuramate--L-alanine ligase [FCB group bacterium]|nr:UDP-N-acetylmuramate--L-alanine ligase [FCB group bacterium]